MIGFWLLAFFCFALSYSLRPLCRDSKSGGRWLVPIRALLLVFVVACLLIGLLAGLK